MGEREHAERFRPSKRKPGTLEEEEGDEGEGQDVEPPVAPVDG
jgi:hypothetical protein